MSTRTREAAVEIVKIISEVILMRLKTALKIKTRLKRERKDDSEISNLGDQKTIIIRDYKKNRQRRNGALSGKAITCQGNRVQLKTFFNKRVPFQAY